MNSLLYKKRYLKTGIKDFDKITNGIPDGKIVELVGSSDTGKTKLLFDIIDNLKTEDIIICYIATNSNSLGYLKSRKLDKNEKLIITVSNNEDEVLTIIKKYINIVDLFILDNIAEVLTKNEYNNMNLKINQDMPNFLSNLNSIFYGEKSSIIVVNYLINKNNKSIPRWDKLFNQYCSIRIKINKNKLKLLSNKTKNNVLGGGFYELFLEHNRLQK